MGFKSFEVWDVEKKIFVLMKWLASFYIVLVLCVFLLCSQIDCIVLNTLVSLDGKRRNPSMSGMSFIAIEQFNQFGDVDRDIKPI